ncbi:MAG: acetylxylan esterase [Verrucomicrobiales bacterium]|nr:acetylxylan esterase [Verrucomicrobiales bacterium]
MKRPGLAPRSGAPRTAPAASDRAGSWRPLRTVVAVALAVAGLGGVRAALGQTPVANEDESKVPSYTLPDPLIRSDGDRVTTAREWRKVRRPELLEIFREQVYGHSPGRPASMRFEVRQNEPEAMGGKATRREVRIWFTDRRQDLWMDLLVYIPNGAGKRVPAFLGLNFEGNHSVTLDPAVTLSTRWFRNDEKRGRVNNRATEAARGTEASRWSIDRLIAGGYAVATAYYGDIEPDHAEGWRQGVRGFFPVRSDGRVEVVEGGVDPGHSDWGAIGAWAWGLSRAMDYLETDPAVDARKVAVMGHSRLGKTALWAGAQDERFAIVISNNSGEGGAALARRRFGETTRRINTSFPHWFCTHFKRYNDREDDLPVDQHELLALSAPRPLYVASAEKDLWADPRGEFLSAVGADPVYRLLRTPGLGVSVFPALNQPVGHTIGYHVRSGVHDVTDYDWERYIQFANRHFRR